MRPLAGISISKHGVIQLDLALVVGDDSSIGFSGKDLKVIPDKHRIICDEKLAVLYTQLLKTENMDLFTFLKTSMAYTGHILK